MRSLRFAILFTLALSACSMPPPVTAPIDPTQGTMFNFNVQQIKFVDYTSSHPLLDFAADKRFSPPIADVMRIWTNSHLGAVGTSGQGVFTLRRAYVTQQQLVTSGNFMQRDQGVKYIGHIEAEFAIQGGHSYAVATTTVVHSASAPEHPSDDEVQVAYRTMLDGLMSDFGKYFEQAVHEHLNDSLVTVPVLGDTRPPVIVPADAAAQNP